MKYSYTLQNLNCAHCAGKIEQKIGENSRIWKCKVSNFDKSKL